MLIEVECVEPPVVVAALNKTFGATLRVLWVRACVCFFGVWGEWMNYISLHFFPYCFCCHMFFFLNFCSSAQRYPKRIWAAAGFDSCFCTVSTSRDCKIRVKITSALAKEKL